MRCLKCALYHAVLAALAVQNGKRYGHRADVPLYKKAALASDAHRKGGNVARYLAAWHLPLCVPISVFGYVDGEHGEFLLVYHFVNAFCAANGNITLAALAPKNKGD